MNGTIDIKGIERKAWTSFHQDGLLDIYLGLLLVIFAVLGTFFENGVSRWLYYSIFLALLAVACLLFLAGKRYFTMPRLGRVRFGVDRRRRKVHLIISMSCLAAVNLVLAGLIALGKKYPATWGRYVPGELALSAIVCVLVGAALAFIAYMLNFNRGYYIAAVYAAAFLVMEYFKTTLGYWIGGVGVLLSGLMLLILFLIKHPLHEAGKEQEEKG
jgi:hypothetical protein